MPLSWFCINMCVCLILTCSIRVIPKLYQTLHIGDESWLPEPCCCCCSRMAAVPGRFFVPFTRSKVHWILPWKDQPLHGSGGTAGEKSLISLGSVGLAAYTVLRNLCRRSFLKQGVRSANLKKQYQPLVIAEILFWSEESKRRRVNRWVRGRTSSFVS